jgi:3-methyladenine DNA glycosylase AlkC
MVGLSQDFRLRDVFNQRRISALADRIGGVHRSFDQTAFVRQATRHLGDLNVLERSRQITDALAEFLPDDYPETVQILVDALGPPLPNPGKTDWDSFILMPQTGFVSRYGKGHWQLSMNALYEMTQRFSAEADLRTFIDLDFVRAMTVLRGWATDPSPHVRRLVSEGTRPRLPLTGRIRRFIEDPQPVFDLLELLKNDESDYVRRSVANNLNDISKDNPDPVLLLLERWQRVECEETLWIVNHGVRTLLKQGHPRAVALAGFTPNPKLEVELRLARKRLRIGGTLSFELRIESTASAEQNLILDYVVHFVKASGDTAPKVFKWTRRRLGPGKTIHLSRRQHLAPTSGRRLYPGRHALAVQINGQQHRAVEFTLRS